MQSYLLATSNVPYFSTKNESITLWKWQTFEGKIWSRFMTPKKQRLIFLVTYWLIHGVWNRCKYFLWRTTNIFISNITRIVVNQKYFKALFPLIRYSTRIIEFDHVNLPSSISFEDDVYREFLDIDSNSMLSKKNSVSKTYFFTLF